MPYKNVADKQAANKRNYEEKRKGTRFKSWTCIVYPESMPANWEEILSELHLKIYVSPVHDRDKWSEADARTNPKITAGALKKAHRHLIIEYPNPVDLETFINDIRPLNGSTFVKNVRDLVAMVRYLTHKDDPNKAQYDRSEILTFGGADLGLYDDLGTSERHETLKEMRRFIREHNIIDFAVFYDFCDDCMDTWSRLLNDSCTYSIKEYISSRRAMMRDRNYSGAVNLIDTDTGEVIEDDNDGSTNSGGTESQ